MGWWSFVVMFILIALVTKNINLENEISDRGKCCYICLSINCLLWRVGSWVFCPLGLNFAIADCHWQCWHVWKSDKFLSETLNSKYSQPSKPIVLQFLVFSCPENIFSSILQTFTTVDKDLFILVEIFRNVQQLTKICIKIIHMAKTRKPLCLKFVIKYINEACHLFSRLFSV